MIYRQTIQIVFVLLLLLYKCIQRFDVMGENFLDVEVNKAAKVTCSVQ